MVSFQAKEVEETIEGLLLRLEEFCALTDVVSVCLEVWVETQGPRLPFLEVFWGSHSGGDLVTRRRGRSVSQ